MLNKFSIAKRLALGFGIVLALLLAVAFSGYWGMESVTNETVSMLHGDQAISQKSDEVKIGTLQLRRFEKDMLLNLDNASKLHEYQEKWKTQLSELKSDVAELESLPISAEEGHHRDEERSWRLRTWDRFHHSRYRCRHGEDSARRQRAAHAGER